MGASRGSLHVLRCWRGPVARYVTSFAEPLGHGTHGLVLACLGPSHVHEFALPGIDVVWPFARPTIVIGHELFARSALLVSRLAAGRHALLALRVLASLLTQAVQQLLLLLGRHVVERFASPTPQVFGLLLLTLGIARPVGKVPKSFGQALSLITLRLAMLSAFLLAFLFLGLFAGLFAGLLARSLLGRLVTRLRWIGRSARR